MGLFPWQTGRLNPRSGGRIGGYGDANHVDEAGNGARGTGEQKVALILGVTGIVGNYLASILSQPQAPGGPWKVYGVARKPKPEWLSEVAPELEYVQSDLLDREQTLSQLSVLQDVTHVFFVTWKDGGSEAENIKANSSMLQNSVDAIVPHAKNLQHIVLQTGGKHYTGPFELAGKIQSRKPPFVESSPRLPCDQYYHNQEDIVFEAANQTGGRFRYSIHRPTVIFGFAAGNLMNMVGTLVVYALICKHEKKPLVFPGNQFTYERLFDASDAELIAEQEIWACLEPDAKNEAFNITNGDVFKWKRLWHLLAERFGLEVPEYNSEKPAPRMVDLMQGKDEIWEAIVKQNGLRQVKLSDIAHWWFVDFIFNQEVENVSSMNKSREYGFLGWRDTEKSFLDVMDKMKENNLIP